MRFKLSNLVVAASSIFVSLALIFSGLAGAQSVNQNTTITVGVGDTVMQIDGTTSPGAQVFFEENSSIIGSTVADGAGSFSQTFPAQTPGIHTVEIFAIDSLGRITDTITETVNLTEHFTTTLEVILPPTIALDDADVPKGQPVLIQGETIPNGNVSVTVDGQTIAVTTAGADGKWSYSIQTANLNPGQHQVYVLVQNGIGEQSKPTNPRGFNVHAIPVVQTPTTPTAPVVPGPSVQEPAAPVILQPEDGDIVDGDEVIVIGTAPPGTQVELWNRGKPIASTFADDNGNWRIRLQLTEYVYELVARACLRGVCSNFSDPVTFFRKSPPANGFKIELSNYMLRGNTLKPVVAYFIIYGGNAPYKITIDWGDGNVETLTVNNKEFNVTHHYKKPGKYNAEVTGTDRDGFKAFTEFSADISEGPRTWMVQFGLPIIFLILALVVMLFTWFKYRAKELKDRNSDPNN